MYTMTDTLIEFIADMDITKRENKFLSKFFMREKIKFFKRKLMSYMYKPEYTVHDITKICQFISTIEKQGLYKSDDVVRIMYGIIKDPNTGVCSFASDIKVSVKESNSSVDFHYKTVKFINPYALHSSVNDPDDRDNIEIFIHTSGPVIGEFSEIYKTSDTLKNYSCKKIYSIKAPKKAEEIAIDSSCSILCNAIIIVIEEIVSNLKERYLS